MRVFAVRECKDIAIYVLLKTYLVADGKGEGKVTSVLVVRIFLLVHLGQSDIVAGIEYNVVIEFIAQTNRDREVELVEIILAALVKFL